MWVIQVKLSSNPLNGPNVYFWIRVLDNKNQLNTEITGQANSNIGLEQPQKFVLIELKNVF